MNKESREALKIFKDTFINQATPTEALEFYGLVLKGNAASRQAWAVSRVIDLNTLDPLIKAFIMSDTVLTREDLAFVAAVHIADHVNGSGIWAWKWWPWNWRWFK